jgi:hypothetical protein
MAKPEISFKVGAVHASVFRNMVVNNGKMVPLFKVVIEVRHTDKTGRWNGTNSLSLNDIPKAILALQKAFEYLTEHKTPLQTCHRLTSPLPHHRKNPLFSLPAGKTPLTLSLSTSYH